VPDHPIEAGGGRDLYKQEMAVFTNPLMTAFYVVSMLVVGSHLWHGASSAIQSLGLPNVEATSGCAPPTRRPEDSGAKSPRNLPVLVRAHALTSRSTSESRSTNREELQ
jgi:hypothetical protein